MYSGQLQDVLGMEFEKKLQVEEELMYQWDVLLGKGMEFQKVVELMGLGSVVLNFQNLLWRQFGMRDQGPRKMRGMMQVRSEI